MADGTRISKLDGGGQLLSDRVHRFTKMDGKHEQFFQELRRDRDGTPGQSSGIRPDGGGI